MKNKVNYKVIMGKVGKNPEQDWVLAISVFFFLILVAIIVSVFHFFDIRSFIKTGVLTGDSFSSQSVKTKEEELRDIIDIYIEKKKAHESLLGKSKTEVEKSVATSTATSTAAASTTAPSKSSAQ